MSCMVLTLAIENAAVDPLGAKEAAAMALERLGGVRVLQVELQEPEQLGLDGVSPEQPIRRPPAPAGGQAPVPSAPAPRRPQYSRTTEMVCCLSCDLYRKQSGRDKAGRFYYGICRRTGRPVYSLKDQCDEWIRKEGRT